MVDLFYWLNCYNFYFTVFFCFVLFFKEIAQANGGNDIEEAVITAPLHFNDEQKTEIRCR